jgi:hypothetical protein
MERDATSGSLMLSAIVLYELSRQPRSLDPLEVLVRTLSSLVKANIEGLLGDVAIAGPAEQGLGLVADHAGCGLIEAAGEVEWLGQAIEAARGPNVLLLRSGFALQAGFTDEVGDLLNARSPGGVCQRAALLRAAPEIVIERLFPAAAPLAGLIAPRDRCIAAAAGRLAALARTVKPSMTLRTRARRIG